MASTLAGLGAARYVSVTTFRRDGTPVPTPVWVVPDGEAIAIWTPRDAGKVKRIRRNARVLVEACNAVGKRIGEDPAVSGRAVILDPTAAEPLRREIGRKYGLIGRLTVFLSRVRRGRTGTVCIRISQA